jgi:hypothetical protein
VLKTQTQAPPARHQACWSAADLAEWAKLCRQAKNDDYRLDDYWHHFAVMADWLEEKEGDPDEPLAPWYRAAALCMRRWPSSPGRTWPKWEWLLDCKHEGYLFRAHMGPAPHASVVRMERVKPGHPSRYYLGRSRYFYRYQPLSCFTGFHFDFAGLSAHWPGPVDFNRVVPCVRWSHDPDRHYSPGCGSLAFRDGSLDPVLQEWWGTFLDRLLRSTEVKPRPKLIPGKVLAGTVPLYSVPGAIVYDHEGYACHANRK